MAPFPQHIKDALFPVIHETLRHASEGPSGKPVLSTKADCEGAKFHSPNPLVLYYEPIVPTSVWSDCPDDAHVWLCGNCRANLAVYISLLVEHQGVLEWPVRREFGNRIRALGERGWELYRARTVQIGSPAT